MIIDHKKIWTNVIRANSDQEELFMDNDISWLTVSNGKNLYTMPAIPWDFDAEGDKYVANAYKIQKYNNGEWSELVSLEKSEIEKTRLGLQVAISSTDDVFLMDSMIGTLYKVKDDKIIKIIDYYDLIAKYENKSDDSVKVYQKILATNIKS